MEFLNAAFLAGAGLAAVPIVLHLIMRQKPRQVEFPALRFLKAREQSNRRRLQWRHLLLLALRIAAIVLLALALARPSIHASGIVGDQEAPAAVAMVFDTSPRMAYRQENKTRLEAAQDVCLWLLPRLPAESKIAVIDGTAGEPSFQIDAGTARQRIARLEPAGLGRPLPESLEAAIGLLKQSELTRKEIYVFTDLTEEAWATDAPERYARMFGELPGVAIYVIDVGVLKPRDLSLGEVQLSSQVLARQTPLHVMTELDSIDVDGDRVVEMYLTDDAGQLQKRGERSVKITGGGAEPLDFASSGLEVGTHQGYVRIVGEDNLSIDNIRYFTVEVKPPWRVLIAAQQPAEFHAANFAEALAPADYRRTGHARYECDVTDFTDLPHKALDSYAAVCLLDPSSIAENTWRQLADYARAGGGVGIFLGPAAEQHFTQFNSDAAQELLPGSLEFIARFPDGNNYISTQHDQHPVMARFRARRGNVPWEEFPIYRFWHYANLHDGANTATAMTTGQPLLVERPLGKGRVMTLATPVSELPDVPDSERWNELWGVGAWPFFTLINETMLYLVGGGDERFNYSAGQAAVLYIDPEKRFPTYLVSPPSGESLRQAPNPQNAVVVTATQTAGNYRVRAGGEKDGVNRGFSVNLAPEATQLVRTDEAQLQRVFGEQAFHIARDKEQIDRHVNLDRVGREIYPLLIALVALVLGCEHVLANRFYRQAVPVKE